MDKGYIFLCNNLTEDECFKRRLLGGTRSYKTQIPVVKLEDTLFLYNFSTRRLHGIFLDKKIPSPEKEFREKFPTKYYTDDGHKVRSLGELAIDNWLFRQNIAHGYDRKVPIEETVYCDFCVQKDEDRNFVYLEYWGLKDSHYLKHKQQKREFYQRHDLDLIEIVPEDLENVDEIMPRKLHPYLKNKRFY